VKVFGRGLGLGVDVLLLPLLDESGFCADDNAFTSSNFSMN